MKLYDYTKELINSIELPSYISLVDVEQKPNLINYIFEVWINDRIRCNFTVRFTDKDGKLSYNVHLSTGVIANGKFVLLNSIRIYNRKIDLLYTLRYKFILYIVQYTKAKAY